MADWRNRIVGYDVVEADQLLANPSNWRVHPKAQQDALTGVLDDVGWVQEIIVNKVTGHVVDGHMRVEVAITRGESVPVKYVELSEAEEKLILATIDPISAMAATDAAQLEALLADVNSDSAAVQAMLAELAENAGLYLDNGEPTPDAGAQIDRAEELLAKWQVERGQLWVIPSKSGRGEHRLLCGDSTNADDVARLCNVGIQGVFTSPPYAEQRKEQYGGTPADEYVEWWADIQSTIRSVIKSDGSFFVNIKPHTEDGERSLYVMDLVMTMSRKWKWSFVDEFCWLRSGVPREVKYSFKNGFEPVYQFAAKRKGFKFRPDSVRHESDSVPIAGGPGVGNTNWAGKQGNKPQYGEAASDLQGHSSWIFGGQDYAPGLAYPSNVLKGFSNDETRGHEAAFPVQLPDFFIKAYSDPGDVWYDPFMGSGTVFVAAEQNQRLACGMEREPRYCSIILQRLADMGLQPKLSE